MYISFVFVGEIWSTLRLLFCQNPSPLPLWCSVRASPVTFQAAELGDLSVSPSVVISDCYSPDNDALAL